MFKKEFYKHGRVPTPFAKALITFDAPVIQSILFTFLIALFALLTVGGLYGVSIEDIVKQRDDKPRSEQRSPIKKGNHQAFEISLIKNELKQTIASEETKEEVNEDQELLDRIETPPTYTPPAPIKESVKKMLPKKEVVKGDAQPKQETIHENISNAIQESNIPDAPFTIKSDINTRETKDHKEFSDIIKTQIIERMTVYKEHFPKDMKFIPGSYILTIDIGPDNKPVIKEISNSQNYYFNLIVKRLFHNNEYPPIEQFRLNKFSKTFVITYNVNQ